jgi:nicotine blue oxidoreductase
VTTTRVTAGLLLAAGGGRRYGRPKALVELPSGELLVEAALATLRAGGCDPVVVVLGAAASQVQRRAALTHPVMVVVNPDWPDGAGSSLRAGLRVLAGTGAVAAVVLLVDTPWITPAAVRRVAASGGHSALVVATYDGQPGHPVLLGRRHWPGVAKLAVGDVGARPYLTEHPEVVVTVECGDIADGTDIDEPPIPISGIGPGQAAAQP